jgi:hypothetical protein
MAMKMNNDPPSENHVIKSSWSLKKKEELDEIIKHAKQLYEELLESDAAKDIEQMPFVGRLAKIIEKLENFKEKEL